MHLTSFLKEKNICFTHLTCQISFDWNGLDDIGNGSMKETWRDGEDTASFPARTLW